MADGDHSFRPLSEQQRRFADLILSGLTQIEAHRQAGYKGKTDNARSASASEIIRNPSVAAYLKEQQAKAAQVAVEATGITKERITEMLLEDRMLARQNAQTSAAIAAAMGLAKIHGYIVDQASVKSENVNYTIGDQPMSEDDWEREFGDADALGAATRTATRAH
jgi:phage terminase small subunit